MFRLAYVVTHPIQYQAPLLRYLSSNGDFDLRVLFLSDFSLREHYERAYGRSFKWDVALTEGYKWEVLPRIFAGPLTPLRRWSPVLELRRRLREGDFDAVWVHGWGHVGLCQAVREAVLLGMPVLIRGDSTIHTNPSAATRRRFRAAFYRWLFQRVAGFLSVGTRNREFYLQNRVPQDRLFFVPYVVDNSFFRGHCSAAAPQRERLRHSIGLQPGRPVILFAGRIAPAKAPDELLAAFSQVHARLQGHSAPYLLFVGDGPMRRLIEETARPLRDAVRFLGFRNQSQLPALYDLCDVFVLPSRFEPWGLVVNEVMNAARAVIVSGRVGAAPDLVENGDNGFVYPSGDVAALASRLLQILESSRLRARMGERSLKRISAWNFEADRRGLLEALAKVCQKKTAAEIQTAG